MAVQNPGEEKRASFPRITRGVYTLIIFFPAVNFLSRSTDKCESGTTRSLFWPL